MKIKLSRLLLTRKASHAKFRPNAARFIHLDGSAC